MADQDTTRSASEADFLFRVKDKTGEYLRVVAFTGREEISQLFHFRVELCCDDPNIVLSEYLGKPCTLVIRHATGERYVNGIVRQFERLGEATNLSYYAAEIVPAHWLLSRRVQSRIFQQHNCPDMTAVGIIKKVFETAGITEDYFRVATQEEHDEREYVVQYRESDLDFISRLMEEEGIFFFFEHTEEGHKLVLGDMPTAHVETPNCAEVTFREKTGMVTEEEREFLHSLRERLQIQTGKVSLDDFNFEQTTPDLIVSQAGADYTALEFSDYPGRFLDKTAGSKLAAIRLQEFQCRKQVFHMTGGVRGLLPGFTFAVVEHPNEGLNQEYLVLSVVHRATQPQSSQEEAGGRGMEYGCELETIPASVPFRPARVTPKPQVQGTQTAFVVGPSGEEIYTDKYGRVKVQFHWDREGEYDDNSSCWIRVSQGLAGGQYGMMFLPRVGQEVVVDFLEGDPDRPLIVGRVYNNDQMPPYTLPDEKTKSTIKTNSSKDGGGSNEIRFEDKKGEEQLLIHAEKDLHVRAKADRIVSIGGEDHLTVEGDVKQHFKQNKNLKIELDFNEEIAGNRSLKIAGNAGHHIEGNHSIKADGNFYLKSGGNLTLEATGTITLKAGGSFVTIGSSGVVVQGSSVKLNSGGSAGSGSEVSLTAPAETSEADTVEPGHDVTYAPETSELDALELERIGTPEQEQPEEEEDSWIEIELTDDEGNPVPNERYEVVLPNGRKLYGTLNAQGLARVSGIQPGQCQVNFPNLDREGWRR